MYTRVYVNEVTFWKVPKGLVSRKTNPVIRRIGTFGPTPLTSWEGRGAAGSKSITNG